jgi:SacI restriction endonuclease
MAISLKTEDMHDVLDGAYIVAAGDSKLPERWLRRAERLADSPSVAFVAAVGAVLLAKATDARVNSFVLKAREGSAGAYSLRGPARVLSRSRHRYGYDIGSSSDNDPINHSTLNGAIRWDLALERITRAHKPFFEVILGWLGDVNKMSEHEAADALAAFLRVRGRVAPGAAVQLVPETLARPPALTELVDVLEGFSSADPEGGARGMALVAAAYRAAGFEADVPSRNDPRRIDVPIRREGHLLIGAEVKQEPTGEAVASTLARDVLSQDCRRALLAVLRPGMLVDFDTPAVIRRAEREHDVVLRVVQGVRELLHEALTASQVALEDFCTALPRAYAGALRDIRVADSAIDTWSAMSQRWVNEA